LSNKWEVYKVTSDLEHTKQMCPSDLKIDKLGFIKIPAYGCLLRDIFEQFGKKRGISFIRVNRTEYEAATHKHKFREIHSSGTNDVSGDKMRFNGNRVSWCKICGSIKFERIINDFVVEEKVYLPEGE